MKDRPASLRCLVPIMLCSLVGCQPAGHAPLGASQPPLDYVRDPSMFRAASDPGLSAAEQQALRAVREYLADHYGEPIEGEFSIAPTSQGYQVNFTRLIRNRKGRTGRRITEGFGEAWVRSGNVIRTDIGP